MIKRAESGEDDVEEMRCPSPEIRIEDFTYSDVVKQPFDEQTYHLYFDVNIDNKLKSETFMNKAELKSNVIKDKTFEMSLCGDKLRFTYRDAENDCKQYYVHAI